MADDASQIRALIERWAGAVHAGDLELEADPANRLRLSIGLRKENDRWLVAHEHHSFPFKPT